VKELPKPSRPLIVKVKARSAVELAQEIESRDESGAVFFQLPVKLRAAFIDTLRGELSMARVLRLLMEAWTLHEQAGDGKAAQFLAILQRERMEGTTGARHRGRPSKAEAGPEQGK
jgi:hypothetical protein